MSRDYSDMIGNKRNWRPLRERVAEKIITTDGCWVWKTNSSQGYGSIHVNGKCRKAPTVVYELFVGPVPEGMELDHLCRNRKCVNPDHLEPVTHAENVRRGNAPTIVASRTGRCQRIHEYGFGRQYETPLVRH